MSLEYIVWTEQAETVCELSLTGGMRKGGDRGTSYAAGRERRNRVGVDRWDVYLVAVGIAETVRGPQTVVPMVEDRRMGNGCANKDRICESRDMIARTMLRQSRPTQKMMHTLHEGGGIKSTSASVDSRLDSSLYISKLGSTG